MQALLGLFLFSVLLTTGTSLECETCAAAGNSCSGKKETCTEGQDTCLSLVIETTAGGQTVSAATKTCIAKEACDVLKPGATYSGGTIKEIVCNKDPSTSPDKDPSTSPNKALPRSASLLLVLSGFLLLKLLF